MLVGGKGNDTYYVENSPDLVLEADGQGNDRVRRLRSAKRWRVASQVETLEAAAGGVADRPQGQRTRQYPARQ